MIRAPAGVETSRRPRSFEVKVKLPFANGWTAPGLPPLTAAEARILEALADTVFPADAGLPVSGGQAHVVAYFEDLLAHLPLREQILLRGLLWGFEAQALVTRPRALSRFTRLSPEDREKSLKAWDQSPLYAGRLLFQALRGILLWAYVDNAEVGEAMGVRRGDVVLDEQREEAARRDAEEAADREVAAAPSKRKG